ncbi:hypothetical protein HTZ77_10530 [Nonomuraea sp. SMC257]|uniref:Uncharacterized protein n=1 Tax=Nonomuraea montanisoli TaxID=2741721 RepID=A0A7Y6I519_9ACTN|nr:hypothetical protein [Nonomuraea montanisoli]NUW31860.1 hypothetical protein [Nonomuraea montanisoli]
MTSTSETQIRTGRPQVHPDTPSHIDGVNEGNSVGHYESQVGHLVDGRSTAARSTGINAADRDPIMPGMPNLSPA